MADADYLRRLHHGPDPLVLANVWDAAGARMAETAGFPAVATTSGAVSRSHGFEDDDSMPVGIAFDVVAEVAGAVSVPVTADIEAGYGLGPEDLVERLLATGAVGCNVEDTDHHGDGNGPLVDAERQAGRIRAMKDAGDLVVNARVDAVEVEEMIRRGRMYLDAGADCVYPIALVDKADIARVVEAVPGPVNVMLRKGAPSLAELRDLGVARVSMGSGLFRVTTRALGAALERLAAGEAEVLWQR